MKTHITELTHNNSQALYEREIALGSFFVPRSLKRLLSVPEA